MLEQQQGTYQLYLEKSDWTDEAKSEGKVYELPQML